MEINQFGWNVGMCGALVRLRRTVHTRGQSRLDVHRHNAFCADVPRRPFDPLLPIVCALGIAQITAWGTSYYSLGILAKPIAGETGWSQSLIYFGFTVSLLVMGAVSAWAGRAIDPRGIQARHRAARRLLLHRRHRSRWPAGRAPAAVRPARAVRRRDARAVLVWRFRSPHLSRRESGMRTSEPKPH